MSDCSVRLSCLLYTLEGRSVKENKYVDIFLIWLAYVCKYAELRPIDCLQIIIDEVTCDAIVNHNQTLQVLLGKFSCNVVFVKVPQPKTHGEGMLNKYVYIRSPQDVFMYCDIDVLFQKPICKLMTTIEENTIVTHVEGLLSDTNYGAAFSKDLLDSKGANYPGFSAGKFMIRGEELYTKFFHMMAHLRTLHNADSFYCLEQPIFNLAIHNLQEIQEFFIEIGIFKRPVIYTNIIGNLPEETVLVDYMGEPGNATVHFEKLMTLLIHDFLQVKK